MNITDQYHEIILQEFNSIEKLCSDATSPEDKLYFFSATFGIINRVMNLHCDPTLVFMHQVLQHVHKAISQRLVSFKNPSIVSSTLPNKMFDSLFSYLSELKAAFKEKDDDKIREVLEKLTNLEYAMSGNGFYLYTREKLII